MRRSDIPATKSNLLSLKEHFGFVKAGHDLLEQKREVLVEELIDIYRESRQLRHEVEAGLREVYRAVTDAVLCAGDSVLTMDALAPAGSQQLRLRERSIMGVIVPLLELETSDTPGGTTAAGWSTTGAARARKRLRALLPMVVRLAEFEVSCRRLAAEVQKTQRKVNAIANIFIPEYRDTIHFIEEVLEEKDREALFHLKRLKARKAGGADGERD